VRQEWLANIPTGRPFRTEFRSSGPMANGAGCAAAPSPHADGEGRIVRWYGVIVDISTERRLRVPHQHLEEQIHRLRGTDQDCSVQRVPAQPGRRWAERSANQG
jgi:hypothetical protein